MSNGQSASPMWSPNGHTPSRQSYTNTISPAEDTNESEFAFGVYNSLHAPIDFTTHELAAPEENSTSVADPEPLGTRCSSEEIISIIEQDAQPTVDFGSNQESICAEDPTLNVVCFGAICNVRVQISNLANIKQLTATTLPSSTNQGLLKFRIVKINDAYTVVGEDELIHIGVIDTRVGKTLETLDDIGSVTYEAMSEIDDVQKLKKPGCSKAKNPKITEWIIEVNIYGPMSSKESVSRSLRLSRLHLQTPQGISGEVDVDNPHMIAFPNLPSSSILTQPLTSSLTPNTSNHAMANMLDELLNDLDQHERFLPGGDIEDLQIDPTLATKLLDHQRIGVMFQLQRETIKLSSSLSLWQKSGSNSLNEGFRHAITGKKTATPHLDSPGGIIADEMGLGKTLTMLATIWTTLNNSRGFQETKNSSPNSNTPLTHCGGTLVVAPSAILLDGWISEIERHIGTGVLCLHKYHGNKRLNNRSKLADFDIVLTTYHILAAEHARHDGQLQGIDWYRVVLGEAHNIRNSRTRFFKAAIALSARHRWCLTGTPIQNKLDDIGALVQFLRVPSLSNAFEFRKLIVQPIESGQDRGIDRLRTLLKSVCIRRTKDLLHLPEPITIEHKLHFSEDERTKYLEISRAHRKAIDDAVCGRKPADAYRTIFQVMLKLRMLCNHGTFEICGQTDAERNEDTLALFENGAAACTYCCEYVGADEAAEGSIAKFFGSCSHIVCVGCIREYYEDLERIREGFDVACQICKVPLQEKSELQGFVKPQSRPKEVGISTKMSKLLEDITLHRYSDKCIVSRWKKTITIVGELLRRHLIPFVQLDGSLSLPARHDALSKFENDPGIPVLLMTLGTGAVGLNLTVATCIHIIEPQWNPSIESQAIGRALRLGQAKTVTIIRYVLQKTVEQYIQEMQSRKIELAELGFDNTSESSDDEKLQKLKELCPYLDP